MPTRRLYAVGEAFVCCVEFDGEQPLRSAPALDAEVLLTLSSGAPLAVGPSSRWVYDGRDAWLYVKTGDAEGYLRAKFIAWAGDWAWH